MAVTNQYARTVENRVNALLAQGNIEGAQAQQANLMSGGQGPGATNTIARVNAAVSAAEAAAGLTIGGGRPPGADRATPEPGPGFMQAPQQQDTTPAGPSAAEIADMRARQEARSAFSERLAQWGLTGLDGVIDSLLTEFGPDAPTAVLNRIRQTPQYQERFKGLLALRQRGITDIPNEARYIELETDYRQVFREAGLRDYLGVAGSQAEIDAISRLVADFSLSVNEVRQRVSSAQQVVADTPQEVRDSLQRFYGIDPSLMVQYVLDPSRTAEQIQRRANAAIVGGFGERAGLEFGADVSERVGEFLGGGQGIRGTQIEPVISEIADIQRSTQRLAEIERGTLSAEESALSALNLDQQARERTRTLQSRERARFGGSAAITTQSLAQARQI